MFGWFKSKPAAVSAPLALTIPEAWKKPIVDTVLADPRVIEKLDRKPEAMLAALAASRPSASVPRTVTERVKRDPVFATGDLTGEGLLKYMR